MNSEPRGLKSVIDLDKIIIPHAPPKAKKRIAKTHRELIYKRDNYKCLCCESRKALTIDHITPVVMGGKYEADNYQTLCKSCNMRKGARVRDYRISN